MMFVVCFCGHMFVVAGGERMAICPECGLFHDDLLPYVPDDEND